MGTSTAARADAVARLFDVLSDPTRVRAIELLTDTPLRAGVLSKRLGVAPPVMSRHLRILLDAGLVTDERPAEDARGRTFRLRPEGLAGAQAWLERLQREWTPQLASFKAHAERRR